MPTCDCGTAVTNRATPVFADQAAVVHVCPACVDRVHLTRGAGAGPAFAARVRGDE